MEPTHFITVGGGCFWCIEAAYQIFPGVVSCVSGYAGGEVPEPTYEMVCSGRTGHAEVVQVEFDPRLTTLEKILAYFWKIHDPTTPNRQGADIGTQYRSIILYQTEAEREVAVRSAAAAAALFEDPIVTEIVPLHGFYRAEDHHQNFFVSHPTHPYCHAVIRPKLAKLG